MLKKLIITLLAASMVFSFAACNKTVVTNPDDTGEISSNTPETQEPKFKIPEDIELTETQQEAAESAQEILNGTGISRAKLVTVLTEDGHSEEDAEYVADIFGIDWMEMARGTAEFYTYYMPFSYQGIIDHLVYMEFTEEQAQYGADQLEIDWDANARKYIEKYYLYDTFEGEDLIQELTKAGFTRDQAEKGIKDYEQQLAEDSSLREEYGLD